MKALGILLFNGFLIILLSKILDGIWVQDYFSALLVALFLSLVNFFIRPILTFLTLPLTLLTFGLFLWVINGLMVLLVDHFMDSFRVSGLVMAIIFSLLLSIGHLFLDSFIHKQDQE